MAISVGPTTPLQVASVTFTSAQVLTLHSAPVTLIPGVAGFCIVASDLTFEYVFKTTAYNSTAGTVQAYLGAVALNGPNATGFWDQNASQMASFPDVASVATTPTATLSGLAVTVKEDTANPTTGDGLLVVSALYRYQPIT